MRPLQGSAFGVVIGLGGAFAIMAWYDDNPWLAAVLAVATIGAALVTYWRYDRPARREPGSSGAPR
jgi:hypothetical protein